MLDALPSQKTFIPLATQRLSPPQGYAARPAPAMGQNHWKMRMGPLGVLVVASTADRTTCGKDW